MQQDDYKKELILEKYKYLYDNKEFILACAIEENKYGNYFLNKNIDLSMIACYKDFLINQKKINETELYAYTEFIKNNSFFNPMLIDKINELKNQRKLNLYLRNIPTFSVWKILDYVRNWYYDDKEILNVLDTYYNLDRFMLTGIDWESGYYLNELDIDKKLDKLNMFPTTYVIARGDNLANGEFTIFNYCCNEYEEEANYLAFDKNNCTKKGEYLNIDLKNKIYTEIYALKVKKLLK